MTSLCSLAGPSTPGEKVSSLVGQVSSVSKQGSAVQFGESDTDCTEDLGINGNYGLRRFIRIRKP